MIAGIVSVVVIVLTQSFYQPVETHQKKATSEKTAEKGSGQVTISAPSEMVPHGNTLAINPNTPSIAEKIAGLEKPKASTPTIKKVFVSFFKTLFKVIIAPNAP